MKKDYVKKTITIANLITLFGFLSGSVFLFYSGLWLLGIIALMALAIYMIFTKLQNMEIVIKQIIKEISKK